MPVTGNVTLEVSGFGLCSLLVFRLFGGYASPAKQIEVVLAHLKLCSNPQT
jgi:hypothetical protein